MKLTFFASIPCIEDIIREHDYFNLCEVFIIGDTAPLAWAQKLPCIQSGSSYTACIEFKNPAQIQYKYLLRFITRDGEEVHYMEEKSRKLMMNDSVASVFDQIKTMQKVPRIHPKDRAVCRFPFQNPVIAYDGTVTVCCADNDFSLAVGNVNETPLSKLWNSLLMQRYRLWQIRADFTWMPHCYSCISFRENPLSNEDVYEYLKKEDNLNEYYFYMRRRYSKHSLRYVMLELSDICPNKCIMCNQSLTDRVHSIPCGNMSMNTALTVCKSLQDAGIFLDTLSLFWMGEPLMNPDFVNIVKAIHEKNAESPFYAQLEIHTSGCGFDKTVWEPLQHVPIRFLFSVDAATAQTYESIKKNAGFETICETIKEYLRGLPAKHQAVLQYIIMKENHTEAADFKNSWEQFLENENKNYQTTMYYDWCRPVVIFFRCVDEINPVHQTDSDKIYRTVCENLKLTSQCFDEWTPSGVAQPVTATSHAMVCASIFEFLAVRHDGAVTVCCHDTECALQLGSIHNMSIPEMLESKKMADLRESHITGNPPELCRGCGMMQSHNFHGISDETVLAWLRRTGRTPLIAKFLGISDTIFGM